MTKTLIYSQRLYAPFDAEMSSNFTIEIITNIQTRLDDLNSPKGESSEMRDISEYCSILIDWTQFELLR